MRTYVSVWMRVGSLVAVFTVAAAAAADHRPHDDELTMDHSARKCVCFNRMQKFYVNRILSLVLNVVARQINDGDVSVLKNCSSM